MPHDGVVALKREGMPTVSEAQQLCSLLDRREISRQVFVERCARLVQQAVGCSRVGLWVFGVSTRGRFLRCLGIYDSVKDQMATAPPDEVVGVDRYFDELQAVGHVMADDVLTSDSTKGFFGSSLHRRGIFSLMSAAFSVNGHLYGAFSCTSIGKTMHWDMRQLVLLKRIGSRASISLASATSFELSTLPAVLGGPIVSSASAPEGQDQEP